MLFISKRSSNNPHSSNKEACLSIIGLILVVGLISGLAGLIYGLVKGSSSGTIGGAIVLGISLFFTVIFIFLMIFCCKNNNVDSNSQDQEQHHHYQPKQANRRMKKENSTQEITTISNGQPHDYMSTSTAPVGLADSTSFGFGKQAVQSPSVTSTFAFLNQSQSSTHSNNLKQNNYNRH